jgi:hypothetical protein
MLRQTVRPVCLRVGYPSGPHVQIFDYCQTVSGLLALGALSNERTLTLASAVVLRCRSRRTHKDFYCHKLCYKPEGSGFETG